MDKITAAPGKVVVLGRVRDGACVAIAVIQADNDTQALVSKVGVVAAAVIAGVGTDGLCHQYPTGPAFL